MSIQTYLNPFRPNSLVNPGMFVGRFSELKKLEASLMHTLNEQPEHFIIIGERGIGKSSLLYYLSYIASGKLQMNGNKLNYLVIETDIDNNTDQLILANKIKLSLDYKLAKSEPARDYLNKIWSFFKRVRVMDSGINENSVSVSDDLMIENFAYSISDLVERLCGNDNENIFNTHYDALLILIDEADNSCQDLNIGSFLKLFLERLQRLGCNKVIVGLAGLPNLRDILKTSHLSSLRIFSELELNRLSHEEVGEVIDRCIDYANKANNQKLSINEDAKILLVQLSEGYPHFIQQFGHSTFECVLDNDIEKDEYTTEITIKDVEEGAFQSGGALELIGNRYYRDNFYNRIQNENARQVLRIMSVKLDDWVTRQEI